MNDMAIKSANAKDLYQDYFQRVRDAILAAYASGDSVSQIASRIGVDRTVVNDIRNGDYRSKLNSELLIAFDLEFDLGIFRK
jgi:ribosome-binding protein aMBF1 (putative translation factor)